MVSTRSIRNGLNHFRLRRSRAGLVGLVSVAVAVSLAGPVQPASAVTVQAAVASPDLPKGDLDERPVRPDAISAQSTAHSADVPVEDRSQRTESERVFANPDGSWTSETSSEPTQVQDGAPEADGIAGWNLVDPTLVEISAAAGGGWRPAHAAIKQTFTSGGTDWFASLTQDGHELRFGLDGDLANGGNNAGTGEGEPVQFDAPVVSENTLVYKDVAADESWSADLVVRASGIGFEHWWVLNPVESTSSKSTSSTARSTEEGAVKAGASITDLDLGLTVTDVTAQKSPKVDPVETSTTDSGGIRIETAKGKSLLQAPGPLYWDATTAGPDEFDPAAKALKTHGKKAPKRTTEPGEPADEGHVHKAKTSTRTLTKGGKATGTSVIGLGIPAEVLESAAGAGPVTVDPSFTVDPNADTWIQTPDYTTSQVTSEELRVGTNDSGGHKARSYLKFDGGNGQWAGKHVTSATLKLRNFYSGSCTGSAIRVSRLTSNWDLSGLTWGNQPNGATTNYADSSTAYGFSSSCPAADVSWNLTSMVQAWAGGTANYGIRLMALNETVNSSWRRYRSANYGTTSLHPVLSVTYNSYPNKPAALTATPGSGTLIRSTTPILSTVLSDPDGGQVRGSYEVWEGTPGTGTSIWSWLGSTTKTSGSTVSATVPSGKLVDGHTYTVRGRAYDGTDYGSWSANTSFKIDVTQPTFTISASSFTNGQWRTDRPSTNTFTFNGPTDTKSFSVVRDGGAATTLTPNSSGDATLSWLPANGSHTMKVTATDNAGNTYTPAEFTFGLGAAAFVVPNVDTRSTGVFPIEASGPPSATDAEVQYRLQGSDTWSSATSLTKGATDWSGSVSQSNGASITGGLRWDATDEEDPASTATPKATLAAPAAIELRVCFNYTGTPSQVCSKDARRVQLVPSAFGGNFPTTEVGPASIALFSGEAAISETDAIDTTAGVGRTFTSYDSATASSETGPFGPGWATTLIADDNTGSEVVDNRSKDRTIVLVTAGGGSQTYTPENTTTDVTSPSNPVRFIPAGSNDGSYLTLDPSADGNTSTRATLTLSRPAGANQTSSTVWEWKRPDVVDASEATEETPATPGTEPEEWMLKETTTPDADGEGEDETATFAGGDYPTWIGQTMPGMAATCTPAEQTAGCRWLELSYTGTGDSKRLVKVERGTLGASLTTLATYTYTSGRLSQVCGPDPDGTGSLTALCASYSYDTSIVPGRVLLATVTPPGQKPWNFTYDSTGRLTKGTRAIDEATGTGNATWTIVYAKDGNTTGLETTAAGLPTMSAGETAKWGQEQAPAKVFAVFTPGHVPAASPSAADLEHAELFYTDAEGNLLNTAVHGNTTTDGSGNGEWLVDTVWYDPYGNTIRTLGAAGRQRALAAPAQAQAQTAYEASLLTIYNTPELNEDGTPVENPALRVEDTYGPATTATLKDGTTGQYRTHTANVYDDEAPTLGGDNKPAYGDGVTSFDMIVETRTSAASVDMSTDSDTSIVRHEYAPIVDGDGNGWTLGTPTKVKTQTGTDSGGEATWSTQITRYDINGAKIETRQPGGGHDATGAGNDAHSTVFSYYAKNATDPDCEINGHPNRADWAGLACKSGPAAQPEASAAAPTMPVTHNVDYNDDFSPLEVRESSGTTTRVTTTTYDVLGRQVNARVAINNGGVNGDVVESNTAYDNATGMARTQSNSAGTVSTTYDSWGRVKTYTDALGNQSETSYTADGQIAATHDGAGQYTYHYDQTAGEHRGVPTSVNTGVTDATGGYADPFLLRFDAAGAIDKVTYPNGMTATFGYNETGARTELDYTSADGTDLLGFTNTVDVNGRVLAVASPASAQTYDYDRLGRLTAVADTRNGGCTTRMYGFSAASERSSLHTYGPTPTVDADGDGVIDDGAGACQTTTATATKLNEYDTANRIRNTGYTYDTLGRALTVPAQDLAESGTSPLDVSYYANDMAKSLTQTVDTTPTATDVVKTTNYGLDPAGRINTIKTIADDAETNRTEYRFAGTADSPATIRTSDDAGQSWATTRYVTVPGLGMSAQVVGDETSFQIANLHGDIVAGIDTSSGVASYTETDEYGVPSAPSNDGRRYGYLGTHQRASGSDSVGGLTLMGARLYNSVTGLFSRPDPVVGGNATPYGYPEDPVNMSDTTGEAGITLNDTRVYLACRSVPTGTRDRCTYLMGMLGYLSWYSKRSGTVAQNNAGRHFAFIVVSSLYLGSTRAASWMASAHEGNGANNSRWEQLDSTRDGFNNWYSFGWLGRHYRWAKEKMGRFVTLGDVRFFYKHGVSLYNRGYMWSVCGRRLVVTRGTGCKS